MNPGGGVLDARKNFICPKFFGLVGHLGVDVEKRTFVVLIIDN
jgi:hypothetical protein